MTDKCRRRMNEREEYITTEITQSRGDGQEEEGGPKKGRRLLCDREELGIPVLERGVPSPWDVGPPDSVCFSTPKQVVALSEPNFWTHSLQIHCNGLGPKTDTLHVVFANVYSIIIYNINLTLIVQYKHIIVIN